MKKVVVSLLIALALSSCMTGPSEFYSGAEDNLKKWAYGFEEKDLDTLMSAYWPDAVVTFIDPDGNEVILDGTDIIRNMQQNSMNDPTPYIVHVETAEYEITAEIISYIIIVEIEDLQIMNYLDFQERNGEWRIINQRIKFLN